MIAIALIIGAAVGFPAGYFIGQAREQRRKLDRQFSLLVGDDAARLAVEGEDDYDPDAPVKWPFR